MKKKCKICGDKFKAKSEEKEFCSNKCFFKRIDSEEFSKELDEILDTDGDALEEDVWAPLKEILLKEFENEKKVNTALKNIKDNFFISKT